MNIFISGSISINILPSLAIEKIDSIIEKNYKILIGDAKGVDLLVQEYLFKKKYNNVIVYFIGENIRNNTGNWEFNQIFEDTCIKKSRKLYTVKDIAMAKDADYGLMIWDGKSKGTLNNIIEMKNQTKRFFVILNEKIIADTDFNEKINYKYKTADLQPALL
jgi:hypothetical protein